MSADKVQSTCRSKSKKGGDEDAAEDEDEE